MTPVMIIAAVLIVAGLIFMFLSLIGIAKLPDFFTRLHAQGVGDTIGAFLILAGMMFAVNGGLLSVKILLIFIVIVLTNPIGTNLMMIAAINKEDYLGYRTKMTGEEPSEPEKEPEPAAEPEPEPAKAAEPEKKEEKKAAEHEKKEEKKAAEPEKKKQDKKQGDKKKQGKGGTQNKRRKPKPSMKMNKTELISAAEERGISVPENATKRQILDLIYPEKDNKEQ